MPFYYSSGKKFLKNIFWAYLFHPRSLFLIILNFLFLPRALVFILGCSFVFTLPYGELHLWVTRQKVICVLWGILHYQFDSEFFGCCWIALLKMPWFSWLIILGIQGRKRGLEVTMLENTFKEFCFQLSLMPTTTLGVLGPGYLLLA